MKYQNLRKFDQNDFVCFIQGIKNHLSFLTNCNMKFIKEVGMDGALFESTRSEVVHQLSQSWRHFSWLNVILEIRSFSSILFGSNAC